MKKFVIIGNGVAAAGCIEGIRSEDSGAMITVVSAEKHPVYCRPLISYYLEGKTDLERIKYRPDSFYSDNGVNVCYGRKAVRIDAVKKETELDDGTILPYDALCIASGSSPFVPPFDGLDTVEKKFSFMTLDDSLELEKAVSRDSRVLIVGAGLIGLKCAEGLHGRAGSITVCDLADRVLSSILDAECASLMQRRLEENGISFMLSDSAVRFDGNKAEMKSGRTVDFDVLVLAVGVRANISIASEAGAECGRGIHVDSELRTTLPGIYAAGDCTEGMDISYGDSRVLAILPNAYMQGRCAGRCMAGGNDTFDNAIPMNSIGFFGLHAMSAGSYFGANQGGEMYEKKEDGKIKRLFTKDGFLTGFILIGDTERAGIYTNMIRNRIPLSNVDFELLKENPGLAPFGSGYRTAKLAN
jgi:pyridine nucleotide-disulfide oxidoreductase